MGKPSSDSLTSPNWTPASAGVAAWAGASGEQLSLCRAPVAYRLDSTYKNKLRTSLHQRVVPCVRVERPPVPARHAQRDRGRRPSPSPGAAVRCAGGRRAARQWRAAARRAARGRRRHASAGRRCLGHAVPRRSRRARLGTGAVGGAAARPVRARPLPVGARARSRALRRGERRCRGARADGGGPAPPRARRGDRRDPPRGDGLDAPAPARRRGRAHHCLAAQAPRARGGGPARSALRGGDALARRLRPLGAAAGRGRGPRALGPRAGAATQRRTFSDNRGGMR